MPIAEKSLRQSDAMLRDRYTNRLHQFGRDPRTLGWDTLENQQIRFGLATDSLNFAGRSVLDVGCGLADFLDFLVDAGKVDANAYTGLDINPDLIADCRDNHPTAAFEVCNILLDPPPPAQWDLVTMFGVLNFRFQEFNNVEFARSMIETAFSLCREALVVDMLSTWHDPAYPVEDFVFYYDPASMIEFARNLTPHIAMRHDHGSIPQREFMLILRKEPWAP